MTRSLVFSPLCLFIALVNADQVYDVLILGAGFSGVTAAVLYVSFVDQLHNPTIKVAPFGHSTRWSFGSTALIIFLCLK